MRFEFGVARSGTVAFGGAVTGDVDVAGAGLVRATAVEWVAVEACVSAVLLVLLPHQWGA